MSEARKLGKNSALIGGIDLGDTSLNAASAQSEMSGNGRGEMQTLGFKFDKPVRKKRKNRVKSKATRRRGKLVREADAEVRAEVFERDGHKCVRCGKTEALAPSHVYPKGKYQRLRFLSINILTMCYGCHIHWWHKHPIEAAEWFLKTYSERAAQLRLLKDTAPKVNLNEK